MREFVFICFVGCRNCIHFCLRFQGFAYDLAVLVRAVGQPQKRTVNVPVQTFEKSVETKMASLRVLLADDHDIVRKGLRKIIEGQPGWRIVAEVNNGRAAVEQANQFKADIAILDIGMPLLNGLEAARRISKSGSQAKILILTMHESEALIRQVLETGARGYLLKSEAVRDLVPAIEALSQNKTFFTSKVEQIILDGYLGKSQEIGKGIDSLRLTPRQREIVQLVAEGKSSREMALQLGLALKTIETHRANLMRRLDCHSVAALVRYAVRNKIATQ